MEMVPGRGVGNRQSERSKRQFMNLRSESAPMEGSGKLEAVVMCGSCLWDFQVLRKSPVFPNLHIRGSCPFWDTEDS